MLGIIELSIGITIAIVSVVLGAVRIIKSPSGWNFSGAAKTRYLIFAIIGALAGAALITFGILAL